MTVALACSGYQQASPGGGQVTFHSNPAAIRRSVVTGSSRDLSLVVACHRSPGQARFASDTAGQTLVG